MSDTNRRRHVRPWYFLLIVLMVLALVTSAVVDGGAASAQRATRPTNIIILFADGVAGSQLEVGRYTSQHLRNQPFATTDVVLEQGSLALLTSHPIDAMVTDSAAAGSAMSTGVKTTIGAVGVAPDGQPVTTAMEAARAQGKRIGLVTTATVWDASPAAFSVHTRQRTQGQAIVDQYLALEPDVLLGGGKSYFLPQEMGGMRQDGQDVIEAFRTKGYQVATDPGELRAATGPRLLGLFADEDMDSELDRDPDEQPSMAEMSATAIRILSQDSPNGFVLLLENENTDSTGHRNDIAALIRDLWVFDEAVQHALEFQRRAPDTLLIVTGDHEAGGLSVTYAQQDRSSLSSSNRFYAGPAHFEMVSRITMSLNKAAQVLGPQPSPEALEALLAAHFPGFRLDDDLREAILNQQMLDLAFTYPTANALGRMVSRQTGIYWGTAGHTAQPVVVGALGPGAERFRGYMDNSEFGMILHGLIAARD
ncbi:MAG: alkaline phosphatase [Chloroflexota bacterium]|nr:alkaline phosphatase [Chloroflexota bacterium]